MSRCRVAKHLRNATKIPHHRERAKYITMVATNSEDNRRWIKIRELLLKSYLFG